MLFAACVRCVKGRPYDSLRFLFADKSGDDDVIYKNIASLGKPLSGISAGFCWPMRCLGIFVEMTLQHFGPYEVNDMYNSKRASDKIGIL